MRTRAHLRPLSSSSTEKLHPPRKTKDPCLRQPSLFILTSHRCPEEGSPELQPEGMFLQRLCSSHKFPAAPALSPCSPCHVLQEPVGPGQLQSPARGFPSAAPSAWRSFPLSLANCPRPTPGAPLATTSQAPLTCALLASPPASLPLSLLHTGGDCVSPTQQRTPQRLEKPHTEQVSQLRKQNPPNNITA